MMELWFAMEDSWLGNWVAGSTWGYPITLSLHAIGMALVVGIAWMIDLRVLGLARDIDPARLVRISSVALLGALISGLSGIGLFMGEASFINDNPALLTKLALLPIAFASSLWLWKRLRGAGHAISRRDEGLALINLLIWAAALVAGRLIGYSG